MSGLGFEDAVTLSGRLERGEISAAELMEETLARIAAVNPALNAIVSLRDEETLLTEARAADAAPRKGWLHGIPIAIKDLANAAGLPTSRGSPLFAGQMAAQDDIHVARLRAAGAIVIGKTNTPEFGLGSHTFNPVHGATRNPYGSDWSCGGSSGGAAVALAAGMLSVADGSDMMGSLRNPAGWNNVYGMRPSWGVVPSEPLGDMYLHRLATNGPMARSPQDLAALLETMAGRDPRQPQGAGFAPIGALHARASGRRIGWLGDWGGAFPFEAGILDLAETALRGFAQMGCVVEAAEAPFSRDALWESWTGLRSFSVMAGLQALYRDETRRGALKEAAQWEIARGLAMSAAEVNRLSEIRSDWYRAASGVFESYDVLALPTAQVWPFALSKEYPDEIAGQGMDTYHRWMEVVVPASLLGLPVVAVPIGFGGAQDLPMGLQLIGRPGADADLLALAAAWHEASDWPAQRRPQPGVRRGLGALPPRLAALPRNTFKEKKVRGARRVRFRGQSGGREWFPQGAGPPRGRRHRPWVR